MQLQAPVVVVVLKMNHVGKHQQSENSPNFGVLVHDGALAEVGNYKDALARIVQNLASLWVQQYRLASMSSTRGWQKSFLGHGGISAAV